MIKHVHIDNEFEAKKLSKRESLLTSFKKRQHFLKNKKETFRIMFLASNMNSIKLSYFLFSV